LAAALLTRCVNGLYNFTPVQRLNNKKEEADLQCIKLEIHFSTNWFNVALKKIKVLEVTRCVHKQTAKCEYLS
jgi:hypothetical protein